MLANEFHEVRFQEMCGVKACRHAAFFVMQNE